MPRSDVPHAEWNDTMKIKLLAQQASHPAGSVHRVMKIIPHGGHHDSLGQFKLANGTFVASDKAEVVVPPTWREAIRLIDKTDSDYADLDALASALGMSVYLNYSADAEKRCRKCWIQSWICTDTRVGLAVYCLDGKPVAISAQRARKCTEEIEFVSKAAGKRVRDFILQFVPEEETPVADLNEPIDASWFGEG